jgi:hypothetical protein
MGFLVASLNDLHNLDRLDGIPNSEDNDKWIVQGWYPIAFALAAIVSDLIKLVYLKVRSVVNSIKAQRRKN